MARFSQQLEAKSAVVPLLWCHVLREKTERLLCASDKLLEDSTNSHIRSVDHNGGEAVGHRMSKECRLGELYFYVF